MSYGQSDTQAFAIAEHSFAGQFHVFWNAMNENYCIWDYEQELGLDWDKVYDTYMPKFQELDDPDRDSPVSDEELKALYSQFTDSLHDGHLAFIIKNPHTGGQIMLIPNQNRNLRERKQVYTDEKDNITTLDAYRGADINPNHRILDYDGVDTPTDEDFADDALRFIRFALFDGNIAYLRFGGFRLTLHLPEESRRDDGTPYSEYQNAVYRVWKKWFDAIQTLHASGQLGGVIIDVRNNTGGIVNDYQYVLGALLPSGGYDSHTMRVKNGLGRLDFAPYIPFRYPTYPDAHEVVSDKPIVVLANSNSVSMSEMTTWGVHSQPNGCFIGTRTYGGLSSLSPSVESYSETYSGVFGVRDVTPIYGYIPKYVSMYGSDKKILEGVGITPDIEQALDVNLWQTAGRDNQLERAVDYIIQGK